MRLSGWARLFHPLPFGRGLAALLCWCLLGTGRIALGVNQVFKAHDLFFRLRR